MERGAPSSVICRLVDELSWEGPKIRRLRNGGQGDENVLTAEVMLLLSYLPRTAFLGGVLRAATGADAVRASLASNLEKADVQMFPDEMTLHGAGIGVQADAAIWHQDYAVLIEAKGTRSRAQFQRTQLAREYLLLKADPRPNHLLLVILNAPPPVRIQSAGRMDLHDGVRFGLEELYLKTGKPVEDFVATVEPIPETVAWVTWQEIKSVVRQAALDYTCPDVSLMKSVQRLAAGVTQAIDWHSKVSETTT